MRIYAQGRILYALFVACLFTAFSPTSWGHDSSLAFLKITSAHDNNHLTAELQIEISDLDYALNLDQNADGKIQWLELATQQPQLVALVNQNVQLKHKQQPCYFKTHKLLTNTINQRGYAVLRLQTQCDATLENLSLTYTLFADSNANHTLLLTRTAMPEQLLTLSPSAMPVELYNNTSHSNTVIQFIKQGVWHIWIGFDHILFLLTLLLPLAIRNGATVNNIRQPVYSLTKLITAFTLAHSLTLGLSIFQIVSLPIAPVEAAIAGSIILAALLNLIQVEFHKRVTFAFVVGLIHGLGFASVLSDLPFNSKDLIEVLLGFNIGVELGQLAILLVITPILYAIRHSQFYRVGIIKLGSLIISIIAAVWLVERLRLI